MKERLGVAGLALMSVLLATGIAAACGGDGAEEAQTPEAYVRSICDTVGKHGEDLQKLVNTDFESIGSDVEAGRKIMADASVAFEELAKEFDKIHPPADIQQQHQQMVSAFSAGAEALRELDELLDKPLSEVMKELEALRSRMTEVGEAFDSIGELPADYQALFDSEPRCQEVEEMFQGG